MGVLPSTTLTAARSRERFVPEPCAILGTIDHVSGAPHQVPVTFVVAEHDGTEHLYVPLDHKPKTSTNLKRFRNIAANPAVSLLVNHYDSDWNALWVRHEALCISCGDERAPPPGRRSGLVKLAAV